MGGCSAPNCTARSAKGFVCAHFRQIKKEEPSGFGTAGGTSGNLPQTVDYVRYAREHHPTLVLAYKVMKMI